MLNNIKGKNNVHFIITIVILFQGLFLVILNQHFGYISKYLFITKIFSLTYLVLSLIFLKYFWLSKEQTNQLNSNMENDDNAFNFSTFNSDDLR